jgi:hypothetical protein
MVSKDDILEVTATGEFLTHGRVVTPELDRGEILEVVCKDGHDCGGAGSCTKPMGSFVHLGGLRFVEIKTPEAGFVRIFGPRDIYEAAKFGDDSAHLRVVEAPHLSS